MANTINNAKPPGSHTDNEGVGPNGGRMRFGGQRGMPVVKPKDFKGTISRLWDQFGKERRKLIIIFAFTVSSSSLGLIVPYLFKNAIDAVSGGVGKVDFNILQITMFALLAAYIIDGGINILQGWLMASISQRIVLVMRKNLYAKLQKLPVSFFDLRTHGELMSRLANDMDNISTTISQATTQLMASIIIIIGSLAAMLYLSPLLTLASVVTIPLVFLITGTIVKRTKVYFKEQQALLGQLNGHIEESISGIHVIKAFNREEKIVNQFEEINSKLRSVGIKAQVWSGYIMPLMNVINNIGFTMAAAVGGILAVNELITIGVITSFISYSRQFVRPLNEIANIFNTLQTAVASAERVFEVLDEQEEQRDFPNAQVLENPKGHVIFDEVTFGYRPDVPILKNVSFEVIPGSSIALVGPTGAGKTTIINLLARFYDATDGRILIDGVDIQSYTRDSLRKSFGIVLQDTYLFTGSIKENIKYGRLDATDEEMEAAAIMANADIFIKRLPNGYDTVLSESGENLSQGQRQLLAIARAILSNPSILILDEATSSVDTRTEFNIQEAMLALRKGRTSFIIAHRLSTIRDADVIMVIQDGRIVERGNHESLMNLGSVYYSLYYSQLKDKTSQIEGC